MEAAPARGGTGFEQTAQFRWLSAHCQKYGFILRYPEGKDAGFFWSNTVYNLVIFVPFLVYTFQLVPGRQTFLAKFAPGIGVNAVLEKLLPKAVGGLALASTAVSRPSLRRARGAAGRS
ncbi:MAG: D-alanyl-D-alanine carboxypeptidase family protein [Clostridiales Family XIII bacterium]|jgi:hypothetical protein|nr:D-alanyl-D-alanine carboxypeptidase family protein [Clostridiales Family XIII bacterium]